MSTVFQFDCPHCQSQKSSFTVNAQYYSRSSPHLLFLWASCAICEFPIGLQCVDKEHGRTTSSIVDLVSRPRDFPDARVAIVRTYPQVSEDAPEHLPQNVLRFYEQGVRNQRIENWDAAGAMFRKTLDVATKLLDEKLKSKTLFGRIEALGSSGKITGDLVQWAHEIRLDGNDSVHDETPETEDDAKAMHEFIRAFLTYSFTLPALVAQRSTRNPQNDE